MKDTGESANRRDGVRSFNHRRCDITSNVNTRMITAEERTIILERTAITDHFELTVSSRLPASLRDEAIWQYHVGRGRGFVLCANGHSFRYISGATCDGPCAANAHLQRQVKLLVETYDPATEAVVLTQHANSTELLRIDANGNLTLYSVKGSLGQRMPIRHNGDGALQEK
jgi:hypothetical protein